MSASEPRLQALFLRGLAGESGAYAAFLESLARLLRGYFRRRLSRLPDDLEDLVQETLLAIHNQRHTYEPQQPLTAWVYAIARYKLVDLLRRRAGREALHVPLEDAAELLLAEPVEAASEARRDLMVLLAALPDRFRLPILYVKIEGLSVVEAAGRAGMSVPAIKVGVHRGLKLLAKRIGGEDADR